MAGVLWSCKDDNEVAPVVITQETTDATSEVYATSATFKLTTSGIQAVAYKVVQGESSETIDPAVIFAEAQDNNQMMPVTDGENKITVYGLEGNTTYTVYFALKQNDKFLLESQVITTPAYTRKITVIETNPYSLKVHIEVPQDKYWRFAFRRLDNYEVGKDQFMWTDITVLKYGDVFKGPRTINMENGKSITDDPERTVQVLPGCAYVILIAECDADGNILFEEHYPEWDEDNWGSGYSATKSTRATEAPSVGDYTETCTDEYITFNGFYAKHYLYGGVTMVDSQIEVDVKKMTERRAVFTIKPSDDVVSYVVVPMTDEDYEMIKGWVTEKGVANYLLTHSDMMTGYQDIQTDPAYFPLEVGKNYKLYIVGTYNEDYSIQSIQAYEFSPTASTKPASELLVTAKEDPDKSPWKVWFNIKAPNKDCSYIRYLVDYTKEWVPMMNTGFTEEMLLEFYGVDITDPEVLSAINSDQGYDMYFSSWEDSESMLVVASYNVDEKMKVFSAKAMSLPEQDKPRVESALFSDLVGDWTATCQASWYDYSGNMTTDTYTFKVTIAGEPEQGPASVSDMDKSSYDAMFDYFKQQAVANGSQEAEATDYAKTMISDLFKDYKTSAKKYADKYRGQNRMVGLGFGLAGEYMSPWDLFCDVNYSAYDTDELFYDYGPKFFLEISQENGKDKVELVSDRDKIAPLVSWSYYQFYLLGYNAVNFNNYHMGSFPVTVSEDKQTIVIDGVEVDGTMCYPSPADVSTGFVNFSAYTLSPITLTKGWTETASASYASPKSRASSAQRPMHYGNRLVRTNLPFTKDGKLPMIKTKTLNGEPVVQKTLKEVGELSRTMGLAK